jgi:hypothetical protein
MAVHAPKKLPPHDADGPPKRLFNVDEYYRMAEVGILPTEARLELIEGVIYEGGGMKRRFTVEDLQRMVAAGILNEDERVELIEGEVVQVMTIGDRHARCVRGLIELLEERPRGRAVLDVQNPIRLGGWAQVQPDLTLLRRRADRYATLPTAEDALLVIEVCDRSAPGDRAVKVPLYAHHGIRELWLVDLDAEVVEIYRRPSADGYQEVARLGRSDTLAPEALPDFSMTVADILG